MSVQSAVTDLAVSAAMAAVHEILDQNLHPDHKAAALDAVAERARFDADGQRKQDARLREKGE